MIEQTEIIKVFNKIKEVKPQSLKEEILLLDTYLLQYDLMSEVRLLNSHFDVIIKQIRKILPETDLEDWITKLYREDPDSAITLNHALLAIIKIEEVPWLKEIPGILFNYVVHEVPLSPGSSTILLQAFDKTKDEEYEKKLLANVEKITGTEKVKCLGVCYLLSRVQDYLTQAYDLVMPIEELSKGDSLDYLIWQASGYKSENYPHTPEFRKYAYDKLHQCLENEVVEVESLHLALACIQGEIKIWGEEIFRDYIPKIESPLQLLIDGETSAAVIGRTLGLHQKLGLTGTLKIGKVSEFPAHGIGHFSRTLLLDCTQPHVIFITGHRGSGKSYTMGVIAEELAMEKIGIGVIILDPLGVYWSMKYANWEEKERKTLAKWDLEPKSFAENVRIFVPLGQFNLTPKETKDEAFSIRPSELSVDDWCYTFKVERFSPRGILVEKAIKLVQEGYEASVENNLVKVKGKGNNYDLEDIIKCMNNSTVVADKEKGYTSQTRRAMVSRFEIAKQWGIFSIEGTPLINLSVPDQLTVIDVSMLDENLHALITGILARKVLRARLHASRHTEAAKIALPDEAQAVEEVENIPITWLLIDEAHLLVPSRGSTAASEPLIQFAKLGRKPGCGMVLCTQQPSATNVQILSQLDISMCHNLTYSDDVVAFIHRAPGDVPKEMHASLFRSLPVGVCVIADESVSTSRIFVARIRPRISQHAGREALPKIVDAMVKPVFSVPPIPPPPPGAGAAPPDKSQVPSKGKSVDETTYIKLPPSQPETIEPPAIEPDVSEPPPAELPPGEPAPGEALPEESFPAKRSKKQPTPPAPKIDATLAPKFQINLPPDQLKDYMKRLLLYKYRKHLYPTGVSNLVDKVTYHTVSGPPSMILYQIQDFLLKKEWVIDKVISESDLPIILLSKNEVKLGISLAQQINSNESVIIFVGTTSKPADLKSLEEVINLMISKLK